MKSFLSFVICLQFMIYTPVASAQVDNKARDSSRDMSKDSSKDTTKDEDKLLYPELEVTPRASERLEIEAKYEARKRWLTHLPLQFSALMTLYAASSVDYRSGVTAAEKDDFESAQSLATGIGAGWLGITVALSALYRPYLNGMKEVSRLPKGNSTRDQLGRERIAEETLYAPSSLAEKLVWFSVASNFYASVSLMPKSDKDSKMNIALATAASFAPLLFEYRWSRVARQHREYKKKIYGPVSSFQMVPTLLQNEQASLTPGYGLYWSF